MNKIIIAILPLTFISFLTSCSNSNLPDLGEKVDERTLHFYALNDFHGAFSYDEKNNQAGLSRIGAFLIDEKSKDPENVFVLSSGDMFQGGPESNITKGDIIVDSMNAIGFDSMTIGNHEFDWGEEILSSLADKMNFPLLGINVFYAENDSRPDYLLPSTIVEKEGIRVGIIGSIYQNISSSILPTIAQNFTFSNPIELIKEEAQKLRYSDYCDIVIVSAHEGQAGTFATLINNKDNNGNNFIDALFLGHDHNKQSGFLGEEEKVPYIEGACNGEYLSHISLNLKLGNNNRYFVESSSVENIDTFSTFTKTSDAIDEIYKKYQPTIEPIRDEVLFNFDKDISKGEFAKFIAKSLLDYVNSLNKGFISTMGCINGGEGVRSDINEGIFTYGDLIKVYPFENTLCILKINPEDYMVRYYSNNSLIKATYQNEMLPYINDDGYCYISTIDYIAYQNSYPKVELYDYSPLTCRDIVADELRQLNKQGANL